MQIQQIDPPREFKVGTKPQRTLRECAHIALEPEELVTFTTEAGGQYDVVRKVWGFYATPSTNKRLLQFKLRTAVVQNEAGHIFVLLVERGKEDLFATYQQEERLTILSWLDEGRVSP